MRPFVLATISTAAAISLAACGGAVDVATPGPSDSASPTRPEQETEGPSDPTFATCSASDLDGEASVEGVDSGAAMTASVLLDSALQCDSETFVTLATQDQTRLTFGNATPEEFFALPEDTSRDPMVYETVARLLADTPAAYLEEGDIWVWPSVAAGATADEDWDALVTSGLYTQEEMEALRGEDMGYLGWRLGIAPDGTWLMMVAGD